LQVTLLSSLDQQDVRDIFGSSAPTVDEFVVARAQKSLDAGCDGLIASGATIGLLRGKFAGREPRPLIVSPGIRPAGASLDDHKRSVTPSEAILAGSDYLVVGRPIIHNEDPKTAAEKIVVEMAGALESL